MSNKPARTLEQVESELKQAIANVDICRAQIKRGSLRHANLLNDAQGRVSRLTMEWNTLLTKPG